MSAIDGPTDIAWRGIVGDTADTFIAEATPPAKRTYLATLNAHVQAAAVTPWVIALHCTNFYSVLGSTLWGIALQRNAGVRGASFYVTRATNPGNETGGVPAQIAVPEEPGYTAPDFRIDVPTPEAIGTDEWPMGLIRHVCETADVVDAAPAAGDDRTASLTPQGWSGVPDQVLVLAAQCLAIGGRWLQVADLSTL